MMIANPHIETVLLAGGYRNVDLSITGTVAPVSCSTSVQGVGRSFTKRIEEKRTAGKCCYHRRFLFGRCDCSGGRNEAALTGELLDEGLFRLDVPDPEGMKQRLAQKSMDYFLLVIREALAKSGYEEKDIDYLAIFHMKRSAHEYVLRELGLAEDSRSIWRSTAISDRSIKFYR